MDMSTGRHNTTEIMLKAERHNKINHFGKRLNHWQRKELHHALMTRNFEK